MESPKTRRNKKIIASFVTLLAVVIIAEGVTFINHRHSASTNSTVASSSSADTSTMTATPTASDASATYKDGSYSANGSYLSPGGQETITVNVTLKGDVVTASSVSQTPVTDESKEYQADFKQNYTKLVVGKKISTIKLSRVSGSSLTSQGFNDALKQIETKATQS